MNPLCSSIFSPSFPIHFTSRQQEQHRRVRRKLRKPSPPNFVTTGDLRIIADLTRQIKELEGSLRHETLKSDATAARLRDAEDAFENQRQESEAFQALTLRSVKVIEEDLGIATLPEDISPSTPHLSLSMRFEDLRQHLKNTKREKRQVVSMNEVLSSELSELKETFVEREQEWWAATRSLKALEIRYTHLELNYGMLKWRRHAMGLELLAIHKEHHQVIALSTQNPETEEMLQSLRRKHQENLRHVIDLYSSLRSQAKSLDQTLVNHGGRMKSSVKNVIVGVQRGTTDPAFRKRISHEHRNIAPSTITNSRPTTPCSSFCTPSAPTTPKKSVHFLSSIVATPENDLFYTPREGRAGEEDDSIDDTTIRQIQFS